MMRNHSKGSRPRPAAPLLLAASLLLLNGCAREEIRAYRVAKESPAAAHSHSGPQAHVHWTLPPGWQEKEPDRMKVGNFTITAEEGRKADVVIIPLTGVSNIELESVNIWRSDLGLEPWTPEQFKEQAKEIEVGELKGHLVDLATEQPADKNKGRILGAILPRDGTLWFVKMAGEKELVGAQKEQFQEFVRTLTFHDAEHDVAAAKTPVSTNVKEIPSGSEKPVWQVPAGWQEQPPSPMVLAKFMVTASDGKGDVSISKFPGEVGGVLANVNRWRQNQLGLPPVNEADLPKLLNSLDLDEGKATLVDMVGTNSSGGMTRMVAAIVPRSGFTWFYKFMGDDKLVAEQKPAFLKFVQTARYPDAT